jgi:hypothetical protein
MEEANFVRMGPQKFSDLQMWAPNQAITEE